MSSIKLGVDHNHNACELELKMANRHGLIAGATGTGKTVTLQKLAEEFSRAGVPVFTADVKGDLSGMSQAGLKKKKVLDILASLNITDLKPAANPTVLWDLKGENGLPLRATISDMGPILLARILNANETQQGIIDIAFSIADSQGLYY